MNFYYGYIHLKWKMSYHTLFCQYDDMPALVLAMAHNIIGMSESGASQTGYVEKLIAWKYQLEVGKNTYFLKYYMYRYLRS